MENRNSNRTWLALGLGLLAGGAAGFYLASDDGKRMRKKVSTNVKNAAEVARKNLQEQGSKLSSQLQQVADNAQSYMKDVAETTKQYTDEIASKAKNAIAQTSDQAEEEIEEKADSFKKGVNRAKRKINRKLAEVESVSSNGKA